MGDGPSPVFCLSVLPSLHLGKLSLTALGGGQMNPRPPSPECSTKLPVVMTTNPMNLSGPINPLASQTLSPKQLAKSSSVF